MDFAHLETGLYKNSPNAWKLTSKQLLGTLSRQKGVRKKEKTKHPFCQNSCKIDRLWKSRIIFRIYLDTFHTVPLRVTTWCGIWFKLLRMVLRNMHAEVYVCVCCIVSSTIAIGQLSVPAIEFEKCRGWDCRSCLPHSVITRTVAPPSRRSVNNIVADSTDWRTDCGNSSKCYVIHTSI